MQLFGLHLIDATLIGVYVTVILWIGVRVGRARRDTEGFYLAGRKLGVFYQFFLNFGHSTDSNQAAGVSREVYRQGLGGMWIQYLVLFLTPFYWFTTMLYRRSRLVTIGDLLTERFDSKFLGGAFAAFCVVLAFIGGGVSYMPFTSVQRQPVELKLKLTPSVNEHDIIRLEVDQEISDVTSQNYNNMGPATSKRSTKTTVVARDQQTVIIGGLMADRISENVTKIPILGDIPVLGFFFRNTTKTVKKSNIIIAITPYVVSDLSDLRRVAEKKLRERREFIERYSSLEDTSKLDSIDRDLHRKRGMLEEINRTVREMEEDERQLRLIRERDERDESSPIEPTAVGEAESQEEGSSDGETAAADGDDDEAKTVSKAPEREPALPRLQE